MPPKLASSDPATAEREYQEHREQFYVAPARGPDTDPNNPLGKLLTIRLVNPIEDSEEEPGPTVHWAEVREREPLSKLFEQWNSNAETLKDLRFWHEEKCCWLGWSQTATSAGVRDYDTVRVVETDDGPGDDLDLEHVVSQTGS